MKKLYKLLKPILLLLVLPLGNAQAVQIDLLALYDEGVEAFQQGSPDTLIRSYVDDTNTYFENSGVDIELRLVDTRLYDNSFGSSAARTILEAITASSEVRQWRNDSGADLVTQFSRLEGEENPRLCGVAWLAQGNRFDVDNAFSVVRGACGPLTLAHEIGHNMGLNHSRASGEVGGIFEYGLGYAVNGSFSTIMTTGGTFAPGTPSIERFSDPDAFCNDMPCGVPEGEPDSADAVKALGMVADNIANYRATVNDDTGTLSGSSGSGTPPSSSGNGETRSSGSGGAITIYLLAILFGSPLFLSLIKKIK